MGNQQSSPQQPKVPRDPKEKYKAFPGSAFLEKTFCGSIDTTDPDEYDAPNLAGRLLKRADLMCVSSADENDPKLFADDQDRPINPSSALLARALVSEVTDNPKTMKPAQMAEREYRLLKAQEAAMKKKATGKQAIGAPGGVGPPDVFNSLGYACTGDETAATNVCGPSLPTSSHTTVMKPGPLQENRAMNVSVEDYDDVVDMRPSPFSVTIALCMSRRHSLGHPETITRQTAYDFNELQDRGYKYVSSTDNYGWRAGGGEKGGPVPCPEKPEEEGILSSLHSPRRSPSPTPVQAVKEASPDSTHIPIIRIDCVNQEGVDQVIHALASGDIFIPHMTVQPEALSVNGVSPPDLLVRFGCERNEDLPPDEWPNWSLEFMHNQLYEYFYSNGARWTKRPFSITLARKVRWKTVKHMNRYFAHSERVIDAWREKGPQYLDPQLAYIEGGATPDEVARPHGIYLLRNGVPTNYFAPNFEPPYTTKMTRSLLQNVLDKSWDRKRREWSSDPIPKIVSPSMLMAVACGCTDPNAGGFIASEATNRPVPPQQVQQQRQQKQTAAIIQQLEDSSRVNYESFKDHAEEKKHDDHDARAALEQQSIPRHSKPSRQSTGSIMSATDSEMDITGQSSVAGGYATSTAAQSGTTTVIQSNTTKTLPQPKKYLEHSEDWSAPSKSTISDPPGNRVSRIEPRLDMNGKSHPLTSNRQATTSTSAQWSKKKAPKAISNNRALERERQQHSELMAKVNEQMSPHSAAAAAAAAASPRKLATTGSAISLDYSTDGSSAFLTLDGSGLFGQQFAGSGSVATASHATPRQQPISPQHSSIEEETEDDLEIQESTSSMQSYVPTDEELYVIGWAKALDTKSGNYYYFTLDRTKTVWENPLASHSSFGD